MDSGAHKIKFYQAEGDAQPLVHRAIKDSVYIERDAESGKMESRRSKASDWAPSTHCCAPPAAAVAYWTCRVRKQKKPIQRRSIWDKKGGGKAEGRPQEEEEGQKDGVRKGGESLFRARLTLFHICKHVVLIFKRI